MSDVEDMDVDGADTQDAMTFSSRATESKGKGSAANLPVEAQDSLPCPLPESAIRSLVDEVIQKEDVKIEMNAVEALVKLSKGDMRRALNVLQACHASTLPMPDEKTGEIPRPLDRETITETTIYDCIASPHPGDIQIIQDTLLSTPDVASCLKTLHQIKQSRGLALADVLTALSENLAELEVPPQTRVRWCEGLAEIQHRLSAGGSEALQMGGLVGVVREGVELMDKGKK
ncbi:MAG: hypothetical protein Q9162_001312 [Coniocarpon cinnabarinum]